jgi:transglutaminase-like putative cysteine protease
MRRTTFASILAALLLALLPALTPLARADTIDDYWYLVEIQGKKCGHMHTWTIKDGNRFTTHSEMIMSLKRGESVVPVALSSEFTESADAKPIRMRSETKLGTMPTIDDYVWKPDGVEVTHTVAGAKQEEKKPLPEGDWMTPMAMGKYIEDKIAAGEKQIVTRSIEPTSGLKPARQTMKLLEKLPLEVVGKTVPALKWSATNEQVPNVESTEYTDDKGASLRSDQDIGGIKVVLVRADKAIALAKADPPELLESTFIRPDKAIKSPRSSERGDYTVSCPDAPIGDWPSAAAQTVSRVDDHTVKVHVEAKRSSPVPADEADKPEFRKPSAMINSEDEEVVKLKTRALAGHDKDSPAARAERLRTFVFDFIDKKNFDVGFASAAETARTHCGDCTEHAVLLCALLRADGTPARCVSGLVYVQGPGSVSGNPQAQKGFFGYHMWTQAMLPGDDGKPRWTDLDAALTPTVPMDATHLAIKVTSLADGETVNALMDILPTLGKLRVKVGEVK